MDNLQKIKASKLYFDTKNPRLVEYSQLKNEDEIIQALWNDMAVNEIVMSILANGFFENEALYAIQEESKYIVIEGNRRLAAVKLILNPDRCKGMTKYADKITEKLQNDLEEGLPVIVLEKREDAWRYIGFKHVNGPVKWDSYAKAEYIAQVHNDYKVALNDIAEQIGDSHKTTIKLYQGLMVLRQADKETTFKINDVYSNRVYFSHIYTAIMYEGFQDYLGLDISKETETPVPSEKLDRLEEIMFWILGSKSKNIRPIVRSQNPDIRNLNQVLQNSDAVQILRATGDFDVAYDRSQDGEDVFHQSVVEAQMSLQKALSKIAYYSGDIGILETAKNLADSADSLFKIMKDKRNKSIGKEEERTIE